MNVYDAVEIRVKDGRCDLDEVLKGVSQEVFDKVKEIGLPFIFFRIVDFFGKGLKVVSPSHDIIYYGAGRLGCPKCGPFINKRKMWTDRAYATLDLRFDVSDDVFTVVGMTGCFTFEMEEAKCSG